MARKPAGMCIFCGRTGLSKEHIWSDWLKALIKRRPFHGQWSESFTFDKPSQTFRITETAAERKRGCLTQRKVRKVCESHCNNGWMSRAVEQAKPIASELIRGERCTCKETELRKLTTWLAITTVMQEFVGDVYIPLEDRVTLMKSGQPPPHWTMWIGYYGGQHWLPMGHTHNTVKLDDRVSKVSGTELRAPDCYVQIATFTIRNLLFHGFTATSTGVVAEYRQFLRDQNWNLFQLWPVVDTQLIWPRFPVLDGELNLILTKFSRSRWSHTADLGFGSRAHD